MSSPNPPSSRKRSLFPRLTLTGQLYLAVLALVLAFVVVAAAGWLDAGQQARARSERQVNDGLQAFQGDLNGAARNLAALGNSVALDPDIIRLAESHDSSGLTRSLQPWAQLSIADTLIIVGQDGKALTRVTANQPALLGDSMIDVPGVREALSGNRSNHIGEDAGGRLEQYLAWPIYPAGSSSPVAALVASSFLDGTLLQYRSRNPDEHIAVLYDGRVSILTLSDKNGKPWDAGTPPAGLLQAAQGRQTSELMVLQTDVGPYLFRFAPLSASSSEPAGMFGVGISLASVDGERMAQFRVFIVGLALIALGTGLTAFLFGRSLTNPILELERAAESMAAGNLSTRVELARTDELGELAQQMDRMRKQIREAFQNVALERSRLAAVIESMGAAAIVTDERLQIVAVNPAAEGLLHTAESELQGKPWFTVFGDGKGGEGPQALGEAEVGSASLTVHGRFSLRARPQSALDVISSQVLVQGRPAGYVHVLQDASGQEQLIRAKDEFIMNAAHELRSPLASLRASIEVLLEDYAVMEKQELGFMLRTLQRGVVRFQGLVENLVDVGNIQAGRFKVRPLPTPLETLIENALSQTRPLLQARGQSVDLSLACESCLVYADRPRILQVLINLLSNASKYGPENDAICLSTFRKDDRIIVEVTDHGPGIAPEEQAGLFKRFYRGRRAEEEGIGIGLGLALAREIVEAHGGEMEVQSQVGSGTTFRFTLRACEPSPPAETRREAGK